MSVLNQSGEEQVECPLCMEPLEVDDLNFYPCTCGYQICRFCWHRIRTDENGLCPACRKAYSENPADFTPLSKEQVAQLKAEKRQRDQQRKAKLSESRKHLASVRVVQKNLVFVVGLPVRLADADVLKRHEYFGKFGKIHKVVINQSTSYAGSQGPSASAYVTYVKSDDALRAIQNVNNIMLDGRLIKSSLGTTKYCSHFMKNQPCPKPDCMYLHDFGDPEASFTKEQMHLGKHQEYEKKLHDALLSRSAQQQAQTAQSAVSGAQTTGVGGGGGTQQPPAPVTIGNAPTLQQTEIRKEHVKQPANGGNAQGKDSSWPTLSVSSGSSSSGSSTDSGFGSKSEKSVKSESKSEKNQKGNKGNQKSKNNSNSSSNNNNNNVDKKSDKNQVIKQHCEQNNCIQQHQTTTITEKTQKNNTKENADTSECIDNLSKMQLIDDNSSFFSHNAFQKIIPDQDSSSYSTDSSSVTPHSNILNDNLPDINSSEDWEAAFGFSNKKSESPLEQTELATSNRNSIVSESGLNNFGSTQNNFDRSDNGFVKIEQPYNHLDSYQKTQNFTEKSRDILEVLNRSTSQFTQATNNTAPFKMEQNDMLLNSSTHNTPFVSLSVSLNQNKIQENVNGLDQQMSKFFAEFNKNNHQKDLSYNGFSHQGSNGFVQNLGDRQSYNTALGLSETDHNMLLLNQYQQRVLDRHLEEQAMFNLKQSLLLNQRQQQQQFVQHNHTGVHHNQQQQQQQSFMSNGGDHYITQNGQTYGNGAGFTQNSVFQNQSLQRQTLRGDRPSVDDDLGFDPFHETQKALAELIESEQTVTQIQNTGLLNQNSMSAHTSNGAPPNGLIHSGGVSNSGCLPPPPPGFLQHNTHMNSFGSKILPFLNMSNSQQISSPAGGWTNNYSEAQLKGLAPVNDWTTLDPAIVSSSRHFPLVNLQPVREQYSPFQQMPSQQNPQLRGFEFQNNSYTNSYSNQHNMQQQNYTNNGYSHLNTQQNGLNWYNSEIQNQISSPPGFRQTSVAQTKTQEC